MATLLSRIAQLQVRTIQKENVMSQQIAALTATVEVLTARLDARNDDFLVRLPPNIIG